MARFNREAVVGELADRLWRYASPGAHLGSGGLPSEVGLAIDPHAFEVSLRAHLALSPIAGAMIAAAGPIADRLPSVASRSTAELDGEVEGDIDWARTIERRLETGEEVLFVCAPIRRKFESLHARVLKTALLAYEHSALKTSLESGPARTVIDQRLEATHKVLHKIKLGGVRPLNQPSERQLERVSGRYGMLPVVQYLRHLRNVERRECGEISQLFRDVVLAPSDNARLFELKVGLDLVDGFLNRGFRLQMLQAIASSRHPFAQLTDDDGQIQIWFQKAMGSVPGLTTSASRYSATRAANHLTRSSLLPDFIITDRRVSRTLLVEVKLSESLRPSQSHVSRGIMDAFAYLHDYPELTQQATPRVAVVAWDADTLPSTDDEVMVCSQGEVALICDQLAAPSNATYATASSAAV